MARKPDPLTPAAFPDWFRVVTVMAVAVAAGVLMTVVVILVAASLRTALAHDDRGLYLLELMRDTTPQFDVFEYERQYSRDIYEIEQQYYLQRYLDQDPHEYYPVPYLIVPAP